MGIFGGFGISNPSTLKNSPVTRANMHFNIQSKERLPDVDLVYSEEGKFNLKDRAVTHNSFGN